MASNLSGHPASEDAVDQASDLTMEPGVQLEPLAQAHLLGQRDYEVAVVALGQLLGQRMAQDLRTAIDATGTHTGLARKWHCHMDLAIGAMQQSEPIVGVPTTQELFHDLGRLQRKRAVRLPIAGVVNLEKILPVINQ